MLGNLDRYCDIGFSEALIVEAKPERLQDMRDELDAILINRSCTSGTASSLRGKALHLSLTRPGKTGRLPIPFLDALAEGKSSGWSLQLQEDLEFMRAQLDELHHRKYPLLTCINSGPRLWSDASFSIIDGRPWMRICSICASNSHAEGIVFDITDEFFARLCQRKTQINVGELLGMLVAFPTFAKYLYACSTIIFCDNIGMIHTAVNGAGYAPDIRLLAHCISLYTSKFLITPWFEYVNTLSNPTDGGSREGITCETARSLGICLRQVQCPKLHVRFPSASLQLEAISFDV
jgi:hypothetical protein